MTATGEHESNLQPQAAAVLNLDTYMGQDLLVSTFTRGESIVWGTTVSISNISFDQIIAKWVTWV